LCREKCVWKRIVFLRAFHVDSVYIPWFPSEFKSIRIVLVCWEKMEGKVRLDKWLWAARFFKTRSMASQAVNGGKVHLNGKRVKAARIVRVDDCLYISLGQTEFNVTVLALSKYRRPAVEARLLYRESEESIVAREESRKMKKMVYAGYKASAKRPSKRDRRKIREFKKKNM